MGHGATHYRWRPDVRQRAAEVLYRWPCSVNTYVGHTHTGLPDGQSFDVWSDDGRGVQLPVWIGDAALAFLFNRGAGALIAWYIWQGQIWTPEKGSRPYWDPADMHYNHLHVSYK